MPQRLEVVELFAFLSWSQGESAHLALCHKCEMWRSPGRWHLANLTLQFYLRDHSSFFFVSLHFPMLLDALQLPMCWEGRIEHALPSISIAPGACSSLFPSIPPTHRTFPTSSHRFCDFFCFHQSPLCVCQLFQRTHCTSSDIQIFFLHPSAPPSLPPPVQTLHQNCSNSPSTTTFSIFLVYASSIYAVTVNWSKKFELHNVLYAFYAEKVVNISIFLTSQIVIFL